jgi:hypothetical protein
MNRQMIDGVLGTMAFVFMCVVAYYGCEPALHRLGFDNTMTNRIVAGTIIGVGVLAIFALISFVARRIIPRKDK